MKKIVILGSGNEQINAIKIANNLGYYVISLDSNPTAPGAKFSDSFFQCDISSAKSVYEIVKKENFKGFEIKKYDSYIFDNMTYILYILLLIFLKDNILVTTIRYQIVLN